LVKQVMTDLLADMENAKTVVEGETETEAAGKVQHLVEELKILIAATQASRNASERESWARLEQTLHRLEGGPTRGATA